MDTKGSNHVQELLNQLKEKIQEFGDRVVVAWSGGVDSTVVAKAAQLALGEKALCVVAKSESNTDEDIELCREIAEAHGINYEVIEYSEIAIPNYAENPTNRCFFCKDELYKRLNVVAENYGDCVVLDGSNADDAGDYRPGLTAVAQRGVRSPLKELGISKVQVRELAESLGLPNHDKPSSPCLSSRVPYGQEITKEKLDQIAKAEKYLRVLGFSEFRCRHHGDVARLEIQPDEFDRVLQHRQAIVTEFRMLGFLWVSLDLAGFKSGGLNALVDEKTLETHKSV